MIPASRSRAGQLLSAEVRFEALAIVRALQRYVERYISQSRDWPSSGPAPPDPILDVDEIQGNILPGFNKDHQLLLFLQIENAEVAKQWLREIQPRIATLGEVTTFNRLYKSIRRRAGHGTPTVRATWMNIGFTFVGLRKLTRDADQFTEQAFKEGIHRLSHLLGDPTDAKSPGHPNN